MRFFEQRPDMQTALEAIVADAETKKEAKLAELRESRRNIEHLRLQESLQDHHYYKHIHYGGQTHSPCCHKCSLSKQADGITVAPYEWPLPQCSSAQRAVVFESL